jgi:hypothetical protein
MNLKPRFAMFATNSQFGDEMAQNIMKANDIAFKKVIGSYKGQTENSFVAIVEDDKKLNVIIDIANQWMQESILIVDESRKARLLFMKGLDSQPLGDFRPIDALEAQNLENWTLDGTQYYAVKV